MSFHTNDFWNIVCWKFVCKVHLSFLYCEMWGTSDWQAIRWSALRYDRSEVTQWSKLFQWMTLWNIFSAVIILVISILCGGRPSEGAGPLKKAEAKIKKFLKLRFTTKHKWRTICPKTMQMSIVLPRQETNTRGDLLRSVWFIRVWHFKFDFLQAWLPSTFD